MKQNVLNTTSVPIKDKDSLLASIKRNMIEDMNTKHENGKRYK